MESAPLEPPSVALAREDLASRLGVDPSEVEVASRAEVDWPDASLGCPQPGMRYKQVVTNGTLTILTIDGREYRYHAGGGRLPFLCNAGEQ